MARIRTIKPEFFTSEDIVELQPLARLLYIALWCEADKEGRLAWKPKTFKMRYLPADDCSIDALCDELIVRGLVITYGDGLALIPSFKNHQHINPREKDSVIPEPTEEDLTRAPRVSAAYMTRMEEGRERKEEKGKGKDLCPGEAPEHGDEGQVGTLPEEAVVERRKTRRPSEEDYTCARKLFGITLGVNAQARKPNFDTWANEVRMMRELDKRTYEDIEALFHWARHDAFWGPNIQSPGKLREKWDMLTERRRTPDRRSIGHPGAPPTMMRPNGSDYSSSAAAAARTQEQFGISVEGDLDFN
jgi:hypothetical protein